MYHYYIALQLDSKGYQKMLHGQISSDDLHDNGIETEEHVTLYYAITDFEHFYPETALHNIKRNTILPKTVTGSKEGLTFFSAPDYDVLKLELTDESLHIIRNYIERSFEMYGVKPTFAEYKPHQTICYLKKGLGEKYAGLKLSKFEIEYEVVGIKVAKRKEDQLKRRVLNLEFTEYLKD